MVIIVGQIVYSWVFESPQVSQRTSVCRVFAPSTLNLVSDTNSGDKTRQSREIEIEKERV